MTVKKRPKQKGIMKAKPLTQNLLKQIGPLCIAQRKLRGQHCRVMWTNGLPILISSYGIPFSYLEHIQKELLTLPHFPWVGELYNHNMSQEQINSILNRTTNRHPDSEKISFHIFDLASSEPQWQRLMNRDWELRNLPESSSLHSVDYYLIQTSDWQSYCTKFLSEGYEGIILRSQTAPYAPLDIHADLKRPSTMLKFKPKRS